MDKTSLGFQKPREEEYYDINIFNQNAQLANDLIEKNSSAIGQKLDKDSSFYADLEAYYGNTKLIDDFQDISGWIPNSATPTIDTTNVKLGSKSLKTSEINNNEGVLNVYKNLSSPLDLTKLGNGEESTDDDYLKLVIYVSDVTKVEYVALAFGQTASVLTLNRKVIVLAQSSLATGWNYLNIKKSLFGTEGTGAWNNINISVLEWKSLVNAQDVYISFQLIELVKKDPLEDKPNPFQRFGVRELIVDELGLKDEYCLYKEGNSFAKIAVLHPTPSLTSLKYNKPYENVTISSVIEKAHTTDNFGYISFINDNNNRLSFYYSQGELRIAGRLNGVLIEKYIAIPVITCNVASLHFTKKGNNYKGVLVSSCGQYSITFDNIDIGTVYPHIGFLTNTLKYHSFDVTEISHAHHSSISETAKRLSVHPYSNPNLLINGDFQVWQRGTSFVNPNVYGVYTADRWNSTVDQTTGSTMTVSRSVNPSGEVYMHITGNNKSPANMMLYQVFTKEEFPDISSQLITVTFDIETNMDLVNDFAQFPSGATGAYKNFIIKSGRRKVSVSMNLVDFSNTKCAIQFLRITTLADNIDIKLYSVKMELGEAATPLSPRPYAEELALCQRYASGWHSVGTPYAITTDAIWFFVPLNQKQRVEPTFVGTPQVQVAGAVIPGFSVGTVRGAHNGSYVQMLKANHGLSIANGIALYTSGAYFDAEIY